MFQAGNVKLVLPAWGGLLALISFDYCQLYVFYPCINTFFLLLCNSNTISKVFLLAASHCLFFSLFSVLLLYSHISSPETSIVDHYHEDEILIEAYSILSLRPWNIRFFFILLIKVALQGFFLTNISLQWF